MTKLNIVVEIDVDPTLLDPHEVAMEILEEEYVIDQHRHHWVQVKFLEAEWE